MASDASPRVSRGVKRSCSVFTSERNKVQKLCKEFCGYSEEELRKAISGDETKLLIYSDLIDVDVLLARWWRRRSRDLKSVQLSSGSPGTQLRQICRLEEAKKFLAFCVMHLSSMISGQQMETDFPVYFTLAGCLHRLGYHQEALEKVEVALTIEEDPRVLWFSKLLDKQIKYNSDRASRLSSTLPSTIKLPIPIPVERRNASELSLLEFYRSYASVHVPVVITGLVQLMTSSHWTLDHIKSVIGSRVAPLKRHLKCSAEWAKLESAESCTVAEFISCLSSGEETRYLFDWSLPLYAPELATELTIPKYFANDFLQRAGPGSLYYNSWPSLFIAPKGVFSDMHVDSFGSNFWMALFQGKKRWTFFSQEDTCCLYPKLDSTMDPTFEADFDELNLAEFPALSCVTSRECVLCPGEVLFVPAGCPHKVENLEASLAISANFVDGSNFELVKQELQTNGLIDERSATLYETLSNDHFNSKMDFELPHLPWSRLKLHD